MTGIVESVYMYVNGLSFSHASLLYSDLKVIYRYVTARIFGRTVWTIDGLTANTYAHSRYPIPRPTRK